MPRPVDDGAVDHLQPLLRRGETDQAGGVPGGGEAEPGGPVQGQETQGGEEVSPAGVWAKVVHITLGPGG